MPSAYERHLIAFYLANAAVRFHHRDREAERLAAWVADSDNRAAFGKGSFSSFLDGEKTNLEERMSVCTWRRLGQALRDECAATKRASRDRTARRFRQLASERTNQKRRDAAAQGGGAQGRSCRHQDPAHSRCGSERASRGRRDAAAQGGSEERKPRRRRSAAYGRCRPGRANRRRSDAASSRDPPPVSFFRSAHRRDSSRCRRGSEGEGR